MNCATENALNKYQEKLKKQELSYDLFLTAIDDDLVKIQELINKVKKKADGFDGYDFTEEVKELLVELI
jgi:hypothetical protein